MTKNIQTEVRYPNLFREQRVIADRAGWNRFKTKLGMYKPAEFARDPPY